MRAGNCGGWIDEKGTFVGRATLTPPKISPFTEAIHVGTWNDETLEWVPLPEGLVINGVLQKDLWYMAVGMKNGIKQGLATSPFRGGCSRI